MLEATLVLGAVAAVGLAVLLVTLLTAPAMIMLALGALLLGLVVGVPTGFWYHVLLYRIVSARIAVPSRWWLSPSALHVHLTEAERRRIWIWYRLGGIGFVLSVVGGLAAIAGLFMAR
jgi:ABC-type antimicrobial peptide transport system permease subunit